MRKVGNLIFPTNILLCAVAIIIIAFSVFVLNWKPCPMCLLQQCSVAAIAVFSTLGWIKRKLPIFSLVIRIIIFIVIIIGLYLAADQTYIQYFATNIPSYDSSCSELSNNFIIQATKVFTGTIESCSDTSKEISGISLAVYSLMFFTSLLIINTISFFIILFKKVENKC
ncbi:disulfide bond formation protein B [Allofrancisella guangzhouensis]|uniref:Dihydrofolate synthase n=1 Tax=Allofrancisella guangzhouensis TaxID=594679 RepID=A0A0A8E1Z9_9GAMM|nr:disulfide bond formation protein B [Allofrancisella guangzhouensis]AJC48235.1 dihydrofolate synthase [Allofrancisella guangzhouensis]MBK2027447.1 disulfide bond formation protein B [Allofrancisella guangzhouensis]MBK2044571.1 disulfide bond formation protein B [Allofrancisella guangzhouensis]MBK2046449.1 disulfide bond formation protein B [Allofrancisella guangzhouensis]